MFFAAVLAAAAPPLWLDALAGRTPAAVAAAVGAPEHPLEATLEGGPVFEGTYAVGEQARLTVTYCAGGAGGSARGVGPDSSRTTGALRPRAVAAAPGPRAVSFRLRLARPAPSAAALLGTSGLDPGRLETREEGRGHVEWGPRSRPERGAPPAVRLERAVATYSESVASGARPGGGWTTLVVDYQVPC